MTYEQELKKRLGSYYEEALRLLSRAVKDCEPGDEACMDADWVVDALYLLKKVVG